MLESVENAYKDKINMLKEKLIAQRKEKTVSETAHRHVSFIYIKISLYIEKIGAFKIGKRAKAGETEAIE